VKVRSENAVTFRGVLSACQFVQIPKDRKGVDPGYTC
jgi:hypothetical protein